MPTWVLDQHEVAALALDKRGDVCLAEWALKDQKITFPMTEF
jgi:hypothetical protein